MLNQPHVCNLACTGKGKMTQAIKQQSKQKHMVQHPPFQQVITKIWSKCLMYLRARLRMATLL